MVKLLLKSGAKLPEYLSKHNITALRLAVAFNRPEMVKYFIDAAQSPEPELADSIKSIIGLRWTMQADVSRLAQPLIGITIQTGAIDILEALLNSHTVQANFIGSIETTDDSNYSKTALEEVLHQAIVNRHDTVKMTTHFEQAYLLLKYGAKLTKVCYETMSQIPEAFKTVKSVNCCKFEVTF